MTRTPYDTNNIFAKILRGDIPCKKVFEDDYVLAFHDIAPQAPIHILVIPKNAYVDLDDMNANASHLEIAGFWRGVLHVATEMGLVAGGYRTIINTGPDGGQEVPHIHAHLLGGAAIGPMVAPKMTK